MVCQHSLSERGKQNVMEVGWLVGAAPQSVVRNPVAAAELRRPSSGTLDNRDRADLIGERFAGVPPRPTPFGAVPYFNAAAFSLAAPGTFGNLGRNVLYGPGFASVDFSVLKKTVFVERLRFQLRAEIFNLFDRADLAIRFHGEHRVKLRPYPRQPGTATRCPA